MTSGAKDSSAPRHEGFALRLLQARDIDRLDCEPSLSQRIGERDDRRDVVGKEHGAIEDDRRARDAARPAGGRKSAGVGDGSAFAPLRRTADEG